MTYRVDEVLERLSKSHFRSSFHLRKQELAYVQEKGLDEVIEHARRFVAQRIAPAQIPNDGKQTPYRGHPVFIAQHATAVCCRSCVQKWHGLAKGVELSAEQQAYLVEILAAWLKRECGPIHRAPTLFDA
jgi:Domain of unknown function (DUF4186)